MGLRERSAWRGQRSNAKDRGIGFHFEYEEWIKWWEDHIGPNWFQKRGCKKGQYCMARFHDKGDYVVGNVKCILVGDNHEEALDLNKRYDKLIKKINQAEHDLAKFTWNTGVSGERHPLRKSYGKDVSGRK